MRLSLTESFTLALLTAAITAGLLNGYPPAPNGCRGNAPSSGLPEELVANCSGYPEEQKPSFCSQKYIGRITLATDELHAALNAYSRSHSAAIQEARQEITEYYQIQSKELEGTIKEQQHTIKAHNESIARLADLLSAKSIQLKQLTEEHGRSKAAGEAAEKSATKYKEKVLKLEQQLIKSSKDLASTTELVTNQTSKIQDLQSAKSKLESSIQKKEAELKKLQQHAQELKETGDKLAAEKADAVQKIAESKQTIDGLKHNAATLEKELQKARTALDNDMKIIQELQSKIASLTTELQQVGSNLTAAQAELDKQIKLVGNLEKQLGEANIAVAALSNEKDSLSNELKRTMEEAKKLHGRVKELEGKLKHQQDAWQADQAQWDEERKALLAKLERARALFDGFVEHNSKVQALLTKLQAFLKSGVDTMMAHTDEVVKESKADASLDKLMSEMKFQLSL